MRRRLLLLTAATTALVLTALLVPLTLLTRGHAADRATAEATARAQWVAHAIGPALASAAERPTAEQTVAGVNGDGLPRTSLVLGDGSVVGPGGGRGAGAKAGPDGGVSDAIRLARTGRAFTYEPSTGGRQVLVPVHGAADGTAVVQVTLTERQLYAGTLTSWLVLAGIGVGLVLLGLLLADRLGARLVGATRGLARTADRLAAGDLTARAVPDGPPELRLVAGELNRLAGRIDELLRAERENARENAADLAHRLRTPVAALRLDAESLRDAREARRIAGDVAALERSVDDVIRRARLPLRGAARADLAAVARERGAFWRPLAEDQGRVLSVDAVGLGRPPHHTPHRGAEAAPVPVPVPPDELSAALDALIGNVLDHTPHGTAFRITVEATAEGHAQLTVADDGPGFPDGYPEAAARGTSGGGSTGLGIDIARRTAEDAGGSFAITGGPTRVTLTFPLAETPSGTPAPTPLRKTPLAEKPSAPPEPTG
ncbi:sensor histidine kinase [Streptomyces aureoverticillatus]|uniref:sensor histidine kinase n=1 Tax=Streptomyces aureoverticillatus TaxID=66871 RepID=UPI0013D9BAC8|nr:HAMP domain-containing sensor histidine kinase [Streptomyces aureoverticillatus]QIB44515.1 HAMP domain-containing histidine kinase [Streptomyces aureoverticillatus]